MCCRSTRIQFQAKRKDDHHLSHSCNLVQDYGFQSGVGAIGDCDELVAVGLTALAIEVT